MEIPSKNPYNLLTPFRRTI